MLYNLLFRDTIEIAIFSFCIFYFCKWLKTDKTKNMIGYFFSYSVLLLAAWFIQLPSLVSFLCHYAPVALLLFIVLHEKTLQRNLVTLRSSTSVQTPQDWLEILLSGCLATINTNKSITIVIEQNDALNYFLDAPFFINAPINKDVFNILISSPSYDDKKMIWITTTGHIRALNVSWISNQEIKKEALFYTLQCDAIIINCHPLSRAFSIINNGNETKNIAIHNISGLIKKALFGKILLKHKGAYHENNSSEKSISG